MTWKKFVCDLVIEYCNERGNRTFTLTDFSRAHREDFQKFAPNNQHTEAKVRQVFQQLRADELLTFVDGRGTYTLRGVELLRNEVDKPEIIATSSNEIEREYLKEVHARYRGWVKMARLTYGDFCLVPDCCNTFFKDDGERYVEVHHIDALCEGGEEAIWNLSVVCAHHHRMAHFARRDEKENLRRVLLQTVETRITQSIANKLQ